MGYLYRPRLKGPAADVCRHPDPAHAGEKHPDHGRTSTCPACGARFSAVWWAKYYVNGKAVRESTETEKETEARRFLKQKEGAAANGRAVVPRMDRMLYDEAAADLREFYATSGERNLDEAEVRLKHLDPFFHAMRLTAITRAVVTRYVKARQTEGVANGTINRELGVLGRMLRLAVENEKFSRTLPKFHRLKEAPPAPAFSSGHNSRPSSGTCRRTSRWRSLFSTRLAGAPRVKS